MLCIATCSAAVQDQINLAWRGELTRRILRSYMSDGAYYTIELKHRDIDNPDQRATEDVEEVKLALFAH
jgi:vitamin B12/bleomycin/antimicrobial peptide transport system ATP-binding/permease protein